MLLTRLDRKNDWSQNEKHNNSLTWIEVIVRQKKHVRRICFELLVAPNIPLDTSFWSCGKEQENKKPLSSLVSW